MLLGRLLIEVLEELACELMTELVCELVWLLEEDTLADDPTDELVDRITELEVRDAIVLEETP